MTESVVEKRPAKDEVCDVVVELKRATKVKEESASQRRKARLTP